MGLYDDQVQGNVCPGEHCELELVMALFERADKEDEAWLYQRAPGGLVLENHIPNMYSMKLMKRWWVAKGKRMRSTKRTCLK